MNTQPNITSQSWAMVGILGLVWGSTFLLIKIALPGITPFWLAAGRIGFAAALMYVVWRMRGGALFERSLTGSERLSLVFVGASSSAIPFVLISWGQQYVTSGFTGIAMGTVPLMVLPLSHFLIAGEQMSLRKILGFVIGFAGIVVLIGPAALQSSGEAAELPGRLACLGAAACYAVSSVLMRRLPPVDGLGLATVLLIIGAVIVVPVAWAVEGAPHVGDVQTLLVVAVLGLVPTAAANLLRVLVIRSAGPVFMSIVNYIVPVVSVLLGITLLGEVAPGGLWLALGLVLAGLGLSQYGALSRLFRRD